jgi:D-beta-D-heptose 7-phosphate kinase/D-beta-D-heptose 1-phosphate adenosyltransferase
MSKKVKFTVVGDVMLDKYVMGHVDRISPESPVPVVCVDNVEYRLGGAANVAINLESLGACVKLLGVIGNDNNGDLVDELLKKHNINNGLVKTNNRPTTVKERIIAHSQHVVRIDNEICNPIDYTLLEKLADNLSDSGAVIISDYNKGVVVVDVITLLLEKILNDNRLVLIDPKLKDFCGRKNMYDGVSVIIPNHIEAGQIVGLTIKDDKSCERAIIKLKEMTGADNIVITRSSDGMSIYDGKNITHIPSIAHAVYDVTGAGDTVISVLGFFLQHGHSLIDSCNFANKAASIVVSRQGTSSVTMKDLLNGESL